MLWGLLMRYGYKFISIIWAVIAEYVDSLLSALYAVIPGYDTQLAITLFELSGFLLLLIIWLYWPRVSGAW